MTVIIRPVHKVVVHVITHVSTVHLMMPLLYLVILYSHLLMCVPSLKGVQWKIQVNLQANGHIQI